MGQADEKKKSAAARIWWASGRKLAKEGLLNMLASEARPALEPNSEHELDSSDPLAGKDVAKMSNSS